MYLNDTDKKMLWVPPGFAHGFYVVSEEADFFYKCTELYAPEHERAIAWNDPDLVSIARKHVEGAYFTASFYADSSVDYVREFADRYVETFGAPADDFSASAYDAAKLLLVQHLHRLVYLSILKFVFGFDYHNPQSCNL